LLLAPSTRWPTPSRRPPSKNRPSPAEAGQGGVSRGAGCVVGRGLHGTSIAAG
jgi:hypothetical protein